VDLVVGTLLLELLGPEGVVDALIVHLVSGPRVSRLALERMWHM